MDKFNLPRIARMAEDAQLEAKFLFPNSTEYQLRWACLKGALEFATSMAHFLRTAKNKDGNLVFPDILKDEDQNNSYDTPLECARALYDAQTKLLENINSYKTLLHLSSSMPSPHNLVNSINDTCENFQIPDNDLLQKPSGVTPPEELIATVLVRQLNKDDFQHDMADGKKRKYLRADMLRVGNFVSVPCGNSDKVVCINGITKRKIGYASDSTTHERYARLQDVKPLVVSLENLTELLQFNLIDKYVCDGKNYYDNVYHENILPVKDEIHYDLKCLFDIDCDFFHNLVFVHKMELFPEVDLRACVFIMEDMENKYRFAKLEVTTKTGRLLHIHYPKYIHEIQNFIDYIKTVKESFVEVHLNKKRRSQSSEFK